MPEKNWLVVSQVILIMKVFLSTKRGKASYILQESLRNEYGLKKFGRGSPNKHLHVYNFEFI